MKRAPLSASTFNRTIISNIEPHDNELEIEYLVAQAATLDHGAQYAGLTVAEVSEVTGGGLTRARLGWWFWKLPDSQIHDMYFSALQKAFSEPRMQLETD